MSCCGACLIPEFYPQQFKHLHPAGRIQQYALFLAPLQLTKCEPSKLRPNSLEKDVPAYYQTSLRSKQPTTELGSLDGCMGHPSEIAT